MMMPRDGAAGGQGRLEARVFQIGQDSGLAASEVKEQIPHHGENIGAGRQYHGRGSIGGHLFQQRCRGVGGSPFQLQYGKHRAGRGLAGIGNQPYVNASFEYGGFVVTGVFVGAGGFMKKVAAAILGVLGAEVRFLRGIEGNRKIDHDFL